MSYLIFKLIHVLAVIFFVGNIVIAIFWKIHGDKSGDPEIIAHTIRGIISSDKIFIMPSVGILILTGFGTAGIGLLPTFETGWILWGLILVIISGLAFMTKVVPLQKDLLKIASSDSFDKERYATISRQWNIWGSISTIAPIIAIIFMVLKVPA